LLNFDPRRWSSLTELNCKAQTKRRVGGAAVFFSFGFLWFSLVFFWFSSGFLLFSLGFLLFSLGFLLFSSGFLTVLNRRKLKKTKENYKKTIRKLKKTKEN
jgi:protein-S-isoprenylcysteine O-methyltransferase Ste14